ncbi:MAG: nucleotidyltransferase domain-containing protein [Bacteroidota bacterium]
MITDEPIQNLKILDTTLMDEFIHLIIQNIAPEKIILFGSYAYGEPNMESDIDLFIILRESQIPRYKRARQLRKVFRKYRNLEFDFIIYTEDEVAEWKDVDLSFVNTVLKKGRLVYEK